MASGHTHVCPLITHSDTGCFTWLCNCSIAPGYHMIPEALNACPKDQTAVANAAKVLQQWCQSLNHQPLQVGCACACCTSDASSAAVFLYSLNLRRPSGATWWHSTPHSTQHTQASCCVFGLVGCMIMLLNQLHVYTAAAALSAGSNKTADSEHHAFAVHAVC